MPAKSTKSVASNNSISITIEGSMTKSVAVIDPATIKVPKDGFRALYYGGEVSLGEALRVVRETTAVVRDLGEDERAKVLAADYKSLKNIADLYDAKGMATEAMIVHVGRRLAESTEGKITLEMKPPVL